MKSHNHNLNIHYSAPKEVWNKLKGLYAEMPYWRGFVNGIPQWHTENEGERIEASVEPSGLLFYAELQQEEWDSWFTLFKEKASEILGLLSVNQKMDLTFLSIINPFDTL